MQEITDPPAMNSPYSLTSGSYGAPDAPNAPKLGTPVPGTVGGLPQKPGLSVASNPLAPSLRSGMAEGVAQTQQQPEGFMQYPMPQRPSAYPQVLPMSGENQAQQMNQGYAKGGVARAAERTRQMGRGQDTMLVHMTPNEVNSLQGLAMAMGGSLTINPDTGLPEAGWLGRLLPTILGAALAATGVGAPLAAGIVGVGQTALTGDLSKGLMAGLGAFGGASLAGAAGLGGSISKNAFGVLGDKAGLLGANMGAGAATTAAGAVPAAATAAAPAATAATTAAPAAVAGAPVDLLAQLPNGIGGGTGTLLTSVTPQGGLSTIVQGAGEAATKAPGFFTRFGQTASQGLGGIAAKAAPTLAGLGLVSNVSDAMTPRFKSREGTVDNSYQGPYTAQRRTATFAPSTEDILSSSVERDYFDVDQPEIYNMQGQVVLPGSETAPGTQIMRAVLNPNAKKGQNMYTFQPYTYLAEQMGYAEGGEVHLAPGSFVMPARETTEFAKGGTGGQEILAKYGGIPIKGPGDGVSDSIPARIGGKQEARVADGEVYFPPEAVKRIGGGDQERGTKKLYALMRKAEKSRKTAPRGGAGLNLLKDLA